MRKQLLFIAILIAITCSYSAKAQLSVHVNLGVQPVWGPTGYDYVNYYYIPDIDAYYDVPNRRYTYFEDGQWVTRMSLPPRYRDFDLYGAHKVVINERSPWMHNDRYRTQYAGYRGQHDQEVIRDSHEERYYENPNHPHHDQWHGNNGHGDRGNYGHGDHGNNQHQDRGNYQRQDHGNNQRQDRGNQHQDHGNDQHQDHGNQQHQDRGNQQHQDRGNQHQDHGNDQHQDHGDRGHEDNGHH